MFFTILDMNGHELMIRRPQGMNFGLEVMLTLNDGSDPTEIQLMFDDPQKEALGKVIDFFS